MTKKQSAKTRMAIIIGTMLILLVVSIGLIWPMLQVQAGPPLPPRNDPPTTAQPDDDNGADDESVVGAYIELRVQPDRSGLWAVVQWQDEPGDWHDVDGWQGTLETGGYRRWWVAQKDFGTEPFRWVAVQESGGPVLGISETFSLPAGAGEVVPVVVSLR